MSNETVTIWVCQDCMLHHASGECGGCHNDNHDATPMGLLDWSKVAMGMRQEWHSCGDPDNVYDECDCETNAFSRSPCQGCGSWLHGERRAMTLWLN